MATSVHCCTLWLTRDLFATEGPARFAAAFADQSRFADVDQSIENAAVWLLTDRGFEQATDSEIVAEVGTTLAAFCRRYSDLTDLVINLPIITKRNYKLNLTPVPCPEKSSSPKKCDGNSSRIPEFDTACQDFVGLYGRIVGNETSSGALSYSLAARQLLRFSGAQPQEQRLVKHTMLAGSGTSSQVRSPFA